MLSDLIVERCLEKEYCFWIIINYGIVIVYDEDLDVFIIDLWYYYGGYIRIGCGILFDLNNNDLEKEIEEMLIFLL